MGSCFAHICILCHVSESHMGHPKTECSLPFSFQNEMAIYEFIHNFVEVLDEYFSRVVSLMTVKGFHPQAKFPKMVISKTC